MAFIVKNYHTDGGNEWVIGGKLTIKKDAKIVGLNATTSKAGIAKQAATQADSTATTVAAMKDDFNALLAKLKAAGIMA